MTRIIKIVLFAFLASPFFISTVTAEALYAEKTVTITADWRISSTYRHSVSINSDDELKTFSEIFLPKSNPIRSIREPFGHYGSGNDPDKQAIVADNRLLIKDLRKGDTVTYGFTIDSTCSGFEGTFSDLFRIQQHGEVRHARYTVTFPEPIPFQWMLDSESGGEAERQVQKDLAAKFVWDSVEAGEVPNDTVLRVTTFMSWGEITRHFLELYEGIHARETDASLLPRLPVSGTAPEDEKIAAVILLLDKAFEYRTYMSETHNLLPDPPLTVFSRKWGDCKDLTLLGVALLRAMGVQAFPVLLGPENGSKKAISFPDPFLLRHAVMGIRVGKTTRYHDWTVPGGKVDFSGKQIVFLWSEPS